MAVLELPLSAAHRTGCGPVRPSKRTWKRALVLLLVHAAIAVHVAHWKLAGKTLGPLEPSEAAETLVTGAVNAGFVFFVLLGLSTLVFGRFFCGWACHVVAYQDACAWMLGKLGLKPRPVRSRLLAFVPLYAALDMFVLPPLGRLLEGRGLPSFSWHLTTASFWERFPGPVVALLTFAVAGFALVWFLGAKGFCTYGCPYGALFGIADRFARGRIRVTDACEGCGHCTATCTSNVRVHEEVRLHGMVVDPGCMKCMDCVSVCPKEALYFGFGPAPARSARARRQYDFRWPEELALALVFCAGLFAFRGLYGRIPFLLAIGLALLAAFGALALWRLLARRDLKLQHLSLRRAGRYTPSGAVALVLLAGYLGLAAHSSLVQWHAHAGDAAVSEARLVARGSAAFGQALWRASTHLARAAELGLLDSAALENELGQVLFLSAREAEAETHLARAAELDPGMKSARVFLARILAGRGELDRAVELLEQVFDMDPRDPGLFGPLAEVLRRDPEHARARRLAEELAR